MKQLHFALLTFLCSLVSGIGYAQNPTSYTVTGGGTFCAGDSGVHIGLNNSDVGITYQLFDGATVVGSAIAGTGTSIDFGMESVAGTYSVLATNNITTATSGMNNLVTVTVAPLPTVYTVTGGGPLCAGGPGVDVGLSGSDAGIQYKLYNTGTLETMQTSISGGPLDFGMWTAPGVYTVMAMDLTTTCTNNMAGSANITFSAPPPPITGNINLCLGDVSSLTDQAFGGNWSSSNTSVAPITSTGLVSANSVGFTTISYTTAGGCSATITLNVNPLPSPITGNIPVCPGSNLNLGDATNGGMWSSTNTAVGTIGQGTGTFSAGTSGTTIVSYTTPAGCYATVLVTVLPQPVVTATQAAMPCTATSATVTVHATGGTPAYNAPYASGSATFTGVAPGLQVYTVTDANSCIGTASITVSSTGGAIITGPTSVCVGQSIPLTANIGGGSWLGNPHATVPTQPPGGAVVVTGSNNTGIPATGWTGLIKYTTASGCITNYSLTVYPLVQTNLTSTSICAGKSVNLTNSTTGGGGWSSSDMTVATVGPVISGSQTSVWGVPDFTPTTALVYFTTPLPAGCVATTTVTVNPTAVISTPTQQVCVGQSITLNANINGGVWGPSLHAHVTSQPPNSVSVTGYNNTGLLAAGYQDVITYTTQPGSCAATYTITTYPLVQNNSASISVCAGKSVNLTNTTTSGGNWSSDFSSVATVGPVTSGSQTSVWGAPVGAVSTDLVYFTTPLPAGCVATTTVTVNPTAVISTPTQQVCVGQSITLNANINGGVWGPSLHAHVTSQPPNSVSVTGYNNTGLSATGYQDVITYTTQPGSCAATYTITTYPLVQNNSASISVCAGKSVNLTNTTTSGGNWSSDFSSVATVGPVTSGSQTSVWGAPVGAVSTDLVYFTTPLPAGCVATTTVTVNPTAVISTPTQQVCVGQSITLNANINGGVWGPSLHAHVTSQPPNSVSVTGYNNTGLLAAGYQDVITYTTQPGSCAATYTITTYPLVQNNSASISVCAGKSVNLTNTTTSGGNWSSDFSSVATVGPVTSGSQTSVWGAPVGAVSTDLVYFTTPLPAGCVATTTVTVNPTAVISTPTQQVCVGQSITLNANINGGVWGPSLHAHVTSQPPNSVSVTGYNNTGLLATGYQDVITYTTQPGSCAATYTITTYPLVQNNSASISVCAGKSVNLTNTTISGGNWSSDFSSVATVGPVTSGSQTSVWGAPVGAVSTDLVYFTTPLPAGCVATTTVTVNPTAVISAPTQQVCVGQSITLNANINGGVWGPSLHAQVTSQPPNSVSVLGYNNTGLLATGYQGIITYTTQPGSCVASYTVTTYPLVQTTPVAPALICATSPGHLSNLTIGGGGWTSDNIAANVLSSTSSTATIGKLAPGTSVITFETPLPAGCIATTTVNVGACKEIDTASATSVNSAITSADEIKIFPNPNRGTFTIKGTLASQDDQDITIEIMDMLGHTVYQNKVAAHSGEINEQIQMSSTLATGMYILSLRSETERKVFHLVVQQ